jgi:hypothetical protein
VFRFAQENGLMFLEASAKTGECVEEAFLKCSKSILAKIETGELDPERIGSGTSVLHFHRERGKIIPVNKDLIV